MNGAIVYIRRHSFFAASEKLIVKKTNGTTLNKKHISATRVSDAPIHKRFIPPIANKETNKSLRIDYLTLCRESRGNALARHNSTPCVDLRGSRCPWSGCIPPCPARDTASGYFAARTHWHVSASRFARSPLDDPGEVSRKTKNRLRRRRMTVRTSPASSCRQKIYGRRKWGGEGAGARRRETIIRGWGEG